MKGFFQKLQVIVQFLLGGKGGTLDAGEHLVEVRAYPRDTEAEPSEWSSHTIVRDKENGLKYRLINNRTEYEVIGGGTAFGNVVMEPDYRGKPVVAIADKAFSGNKKITSLVVGDKVRTIGHTNFDIADQLADMAMEAIHPKASKEMELKNIPIRVTNAFDPGNPGTLISKDYVAPQPRVDMICGRSDVLAVEVFDPEMVGQSGYDHKVMGCFAANKISYIAKNTNANTITHYVSERSKGLKECIEQIRQEFPRAGISCREVAIIGVIGSNMKLPGFLSRAARALADADINILALDQCMRQVNMQFIVDRSDFQQAQIALHRKLVENID